MKLNAYGHTDIGKSRTRNEDAYLVDTDLELFVVCDGISRGAAGDKASASVIASIRQTVRELKPRISLIDNDEQLAHGLAEIVTNAIQVASDNLFAEAKNDPTLVGMGSTATLLLIQGSKACVGHVGDSRLYLQRDSQLHQLTKDHTVVQELIEKGALSADKAATSPYAHVLTRALGRAELVPADTLIFEVLPGDRFLICCDGLSHALSREALRELLIGSEIAAVAKTAVLQAVEEDGSDNTTAVFVCVDSEVPAAEQARGEEVKLQLETLKQLYVFSDLTMHELLRVMDLVRVESCNAGEVLISEGDPGDCMYVILQGSFSVECQEQVVTTLSRGNHFGEMALLSKNPRSATVRAIAPARLLRIDRVDFMKLLVQETRIGVKVLWRLAGRLTHHLQASNVQLYGNDPE